MSSDFTENIVWILKFRLNSLLIHDFNKIMQKETGLNTLKNKFKNIHKSIKKLKKDN